MQFASVYITPSRSSQYAESRHLNCYRRLYRRATKADTHLSPGQPSAAVVAQSPRTRRDPRRLPAPGRPHRGRWRSCPAETTLCFGHIFDGATIGIWVTLSDGSTGTLARDAVLLLTSEKSPCYARPDRYGTDVTLSVRPQGK